MVTTVAELRKEFADESSVTPSMKEFIKNHKSRKRIDIGNKESFTYGRTMDFLFAYLFDGSNSGEFKVYKSVMGGGKTDWTHGAQVKRFIMRGSDYLNIAQINWGIQAGFTLAQAKANLSKITYLEKDKTSDTTPKNLNPDQIKVLEFMFDLLVDPQQSSDDVDVLAVVESWIKKDKPVVFTGAPGTGKTWAVTEVVKKECTNDKQYKFVQFHPSYDYSDFVEGLRPVVLQGQTEPTFVRMDGVFKAFCRRIVEDKTDTLYYFIVDEINRADLAKVFGELMFGLEKSYRGVPFDTQYKNLKTYRIIDKDDVDNKTYPATDLGKAVQISNDVFEDGFYIPANLRFIATMNDIDRSVDSMDFALRRRFQWVEIEANKVMRISLKNMLGNVPDELIDRIKNMNYEISNGKFGLSEAYHIGPAYFKELDLSKLDESLENIFDTNIVSILKEYTRGRNPDEVDSWIDDCGSALMGD